MGAEDWMTCRRCGMLEQKGNMEVEVTVEIVKTGKIAGSFYLCEFCWKLINDIVFHEKKIE